MLPLLYYSWSDLHEVQSVDDFRSVVSDFLEYFPCEECRSDFNEMVANHPFPVSEVRTLRDARVWSWLSHNMVNRKLGKDWQSFDIVQVDALD